MQLPELLDRDDKAQGASARFCEHLEKPRTIAEVTKERLRRAGKKIREENPLFAGDLGFRVFKLDTSNIRAWEPDRDDLEKSLFDATEHIKPDRTEQDVLFELLLKLGLDLCVPIEQRTIADKTVHSIGAGVLLVFWLSRSPRPTWNRWRWASWLGTRNWLRRATAPSYSATARLATTWPRRTCPPSSSSTGWKTFAACKER